MNPIVIEIPGQPVAQGRPRASLIRKKDGSFVTRPNGVPAIGVYDPTNARDFKADLRSYVTRQFPQLAPSDQPVKLWIKLYLRRPTTGSLATTKCKNLTIPHTKRPDWDNLAKSVTDALTGILWRDDSQLWDVRVTKVWCPVNEVPRVVIEIH